MLIKTIKSLQLKSETSKKFNALLTEIESIRKYSDILNLSAEPTGYSWLGVFNAGKSLFPENTAGIPQYFSEQLLSESQIKELGTKIGSLKFDQLIFNGFNTYFLDIITATKIENRKCRVGLIHHGFFAEFTGNIVMHEIFKSIIDGLKSKKIDKIAFAKKGNEKAFKALFNTPEFYIVYKNPTPEKILIPEKKIGVLTNNTFRKNTVTQGIAALCVANYKVVVSSKSDLKIFDTESRLEEIGHLAHDKFLNTIARNTINSHVTFSEASGGQVFTESLAMGVPCLSALTHGYLDDNKFLRDSLIVNRFDDSWAIAEKMNEVIQNRESISKECLIHSEQMNNVSEELLFHFLNS